MYHISIASIVLIILSLTISSVHNEIQHVNYLLKLINENDKILALKKLNNVCIDNARNAQQWWTYILCFKKGILQIHIDHASNRLVDLNSLGTFIEDESSADHHVYREDTTSCKALSVNHKGIQKTSFKRRETIVDIECCEIDTKQMKLNRYSYLPDLLVSDIESDPTEMATAWLEYEPELKKSSDKKVVDTTTTSDAYISLIEEPNPCYYHIVICSNLICTSESKSKYKEAILESSKAAISQSEIKQSSDKNIISDVILPPHSQSSSSSSMTVEEQNELKERSKAAFYHAYDSYMNYAYPKAELKPISCSGGNFDLVKIPLVTLIDSLDTLVILGNTSEFRRVVDLVSSEIPSFDYDVNVSLFETTIRVLGGLLSAHLLAIDPTLDIYKSTNISEHIHPYSGKLLQLAVDLGERLYPAFYTKTGIPYGTINLRYGVPQGETKIASTAGAGSLLLEFQALSHLSGIHKFGDVAYAATSALYERRSSIGLLGKHINTETGKWSESLSGVGSNADSFYEYLLKAYLLFRNKELYNMFINTYQAIKKFVMVNEHWFTEVDMFSGKMMRKRMENLDAFWPGVEAMLGYTKHSSLQLNTFYSVWSDLGFFPEEIDYFQWQQGKGAVNGLYPLRPEIIESTYHHYRTTGDRSWLLAGKMFLESLEQYTRTSCGYATVADVDSMILEDTMPSFFLSETCKYLYLLFDEDSFIHKRPYIFTTEAHPFDILQIYYGDIRDKHNNTNNIATSSRSTPTSSIISNSVAITSSTSIIETNVVDNTLKERKKRNSHKLSATALSNADLVKKQHLILLEMLSKSNFLNADMTSLQVQLLKVTQKDGSDNKKIETSITQLRSDSSTSSMTQSAFHNLFTMKCRKPLYWDTPSSYDSEYLQEINSKLRKQKYVNKRMHNNRNTYRNKKDVNLKSNSLMKSHENSFRPLRIVRLPDIMQMGYNTQILINEIEMYKEYRSNETYLNDTKYDFIHNKLYIDLQQVKLNKLINQYPQMNEVCFLFEKPIPKKTTTSKDNKTQKNTASSSTTTNKKNSDSNTKSTALPDQQTPPQTNNNNREAELLKTVQVSLGEIGDFLVDVYADGFAITNSNDGVKLEISNIGRSLVLIRQTTPLKPSKVFISSWEESSLTTCKVQATRRHYTSIPSTPAAIVWQRPCSIANFGLSQQQININVQGDITLPGYGSNLMCKTGREEFKDIIDELEDSGGGGKYPRWWFWSWESQKYSYDPTLVRAVQQGPLFTNKIVLVDRGDCLFEDKAKNAIAEDASALIIANTEGPPFIMAGKKEIEAMSSARSSSSKSVKKKDNAKHSSSSSSSSSKKNAQVLHSQLTSQTHHKSLTKSIPPLSQKMQDLRRSSSNKDESNQATTLPTTAVADDEEEHDDNLSMLITDETTNTDIVTVMLSTTDSTELKEFIEMSYQLTDYKTEYSISIEVNHMMFNSDLFGNMNYPKIWIQQNLIFIRGEGEWGTYLQSKQGDDWQMFVMSKEEVYRTQSQIAPPYEAYTEANKLPITIPHVILSNSVELYSYTIHRKCPNIVKAVDGNTIIMRSNS